MKKVYISESGPEVSAAIYGFFRWNEASLLNLKKVEEIVNYNLELGVNTFDHSNRFGDGKVEELFGKAIQSRSFKRENIIISTKCGIRSLPEGGVYYDLSPKHIIQSANASLKRLKTDYIDIFLLEHYDLLSNAEETASALSELLYAGKIRYVGVSNFNLFQHRLLASQLSHPIITNHIELNLLQTESIDDGRLDFIREQYSRPMAWAPLADGKILHGTGVKEVRIRTVLSKIGEKHNANVEQVAVAWLHKLGAIPIIGSPHKDRIKNASSAHTIKLNSQEWYEIYNATK